MNEDYLSCYGNVEVIADGDSLCARFDDFENLQESPAGFGQSDAEALAELARGIKAENVDLTAQRDALLEACELHRAACVIGVSLGRVLVEEIQRACVSAGVRSKLTDALRVPVVGWIQKPAVEC